MHFGFFAPLLRRGVFEGEYAARDGRAIWGPDQAKLKKRHPFCPSKPYSVGKFRVFCFPVIDGVAVNVTVCCGGRERIALGHAVNNALGE